MSEKPFRAGKPAQAASVVCAVALALSALVATAVITYASPSAGPLFRPHPVHYFSRWHANRAPAQGSGNLAYHGGPVQHNPVAYVIFWGPGWSSDTTTANVIQNYFRDLGGTSFDRILTQYTDGSGAINPVETLGGVWTDTSTPATTSTACGSAIDDQALQNEVNKAISQESWPRDGANGLYLVYTASNYYIYDGTSCNAPAPNGDWCAYHDWSSADGVAYAAMPYPSSGCTVSYSSNRSLAGDSEVNLTSHEDFEAITDPDTVTGWWDAANYEIGDKCAWEFPAGTGTTMLNNSGAFEMQLEYSNAARACVNTYSTGSGGGGPPPTISSYSPSSGPIGTRVTINGANLKGVAAVTFNGIRATTVSVNSRGTQITATVPGGATTGPLVVTVGTTTLTAGTFTVTTRAQRHG